jgi:hypothetical protein
MVSHCWNQLILFSDGVSFLVFLSYVRHGLLGIWLALDVPRSLQHRPFLERLGLHAFLFGFIGFERTVEFVSETFGYNYYVMFRPIINKLVAAAISQEHDPRLKIENQVFDGVPVRVYIPKNRSTPTRSMLYMHSGGWAWLGIDYYDGICESFALEL